MNPTVAAPSGSVQIKFNDEISSFFMEDLVFFDNFLLRITCLSSLADYEITIKPSIGESFTFIFDSGTFRSLSKDGCVVLSQYHMNFFRIYPTTGDQFYEIYIKKSGK